MKNDVHLLENIIELADNIADARSRLGNDIEDYTGSPIYQAGCTMFVMQIGENIRKLSNDLKSKYSDVDWSGYIGLRNIVAHRYSHINPERIWNILTRDIPILKENCERIIEELK